MELILSHERADFDALASMVAASKLYPRARMVLVGPPEPPVRQFLALHRGLFEVHSAAEFRDARPERIILVDTRNPARLGPFRNLVNDPKIALHIYDHHPATPESVRADLEVIEPVGAAVTVVLSRVQAAGHALSPAEATLCLLALHEETGSFCHAGTTAEELRTAAWLLEQGANQSMVPRFVAQVLTVAQRQLLSDLVQASHIHSVRGVSVAVATAEREEYVSELAVLTSRLLEMLGVEVALTVVRMTDSVFVVGRSRDESANLGVLLGGWGGGGHGAAASASLPRQPVDALAAELVEKLGHVLEGRPTARDLMSFPVHCLELNHLTVAEAAEGLRRLGHSAAGLREAGKLVGWISRADLDKAMAHNLGHAPVRSYMTTAIASVNPQNTLDEIQRLLVERDIGRVPVMEEGELVGIVSRTDVLRWLQQHRPASEGEPEQVEVDFGCLSDELQDLLGRAAARGTALGARVYVVGGFVRDLLLYAMRSGEGAPPQERDVDLVVEGDALAFARGLAHGLGEPVRCLTHERFHTATLHWPDGRHVDVATARTERYVRPAALPLVQGSTLKQDLVRRDFSVNAMAVLLTGGHFGRLVDFFGARRDLQEGLLRVLHNHSFFDDPTRILRAIRFEQRLGFRLEAGTEHLMRQALSDGALEMVGWDRIREELLVILSEASALAALRRLGKLGILRRIDPALQVTARTEQLFARVAGLEGELGRCDPPWTLPLQALLWVLKPPGIRALKSRLRLSLIHPVETSAEATRYYRALADPEVPDSELERRLKGLSRPALLWLLAANSPSGSSAALVEQRLRRYLTELSRLPPLVMGRDLEAWGYAPGPDFRVMLQAARALQLDEHCADIAVARRRLEEMFGKPGHRARDQEENAGNIPTCME